jgi:AbrB family looped-hinge helix DNA binding protein
MANGSNDGMNARIRIDSAGRIVLPQPVRKQFHLEPGAMLALEVARDAIILRPQSHEATLVEEEGLLVHEGEPSGDLLSAVEAVRKRRDRDVASPL